MGEPMGFLLFIYFSELERHAALRLEQLLAEAEQSRESDSEIDAELAVLGEKVDADDLEQAVEEAREEPSEQVYGADA